MATYQLGGLGRIKGSSAAEGLTQAAVDKQEQQKRLQNMRINQQRMQAAAYRANRQRINDARNDEARREAIRQANNLPDVSNFSDGNANFPILSRKTLQLPAPVVEPVPAPVPAPAPAPAPEPQVQQVGPRQMSPVLPRPFNPDSLPAKRSGASLLSGFVPTPDGSGGFTPLQEVQQVGPLQMSPVFREPLHLPLSRRFISLDQIAGITEKPAEPSNLDEVAGTTETTTGSVIPVSEVVSATQGSPVLTPAEPSNLDQVAGITETTAGSVIPVSEVVSATQGSPSQMYLQHPYFARRSREENVQRQRILQDQIKLDALRGNYDEIAERRIAYNAAQTEGLYLDAMVALTSVREGSFGPIENLLQKMYPNDNVVLKPYDDGTLEVFLDGEQLEEIKTNEDLVNFIRPDVDRRFLAEQESTRQSLMTARSARFNKLFEHGLEANIEILKNAGVINVEILRGEIDKAIATIRSQSGGSDFGAWQVDPSTGEGLAYTDDGRYMIRLEQSTDPVNDEITVRPQMYEMDTNGRYRRLSDFGN